MKIMSSLVRSPMTFGTAGQGRYNNFDFLRFLFASLVIFSHSFAFLYNPTWFAYDPLLHLTNGQAAFGGGSVDCFFLISGFLVTQSWVQTKDFKAYAIKRALRILPALAVVLVVCTFIVGPLAVHDRSGYFHNPKTYRYLGLMLSKNINANDKLPGVFTQNPEAGPVDGSLWTIRYELLCYGLVAAIGLLGLYTRPLIIIPLALITLGLKAVFIEGIHSFGEFNNLFHLTTYFLVGMIFYLYKDKIPYSAVWLILSVAALVISDLLHVLPLTMPIFLAYALFYVAFAKWLPLQRFAKKGDLSYGIYLYACPIQQLLVLYFRHAFNAYTLFLAALAITAAVACLSWYLIEAPALRLKPKKEARLPKFEPVSTEAEQVRQALSKA